jgi:hypothetical protein
MARFAIVRSAIFSLFFFFFFISQSSPSTLPAQVMYVGRVHIKSCIDIFQNGKNPHYTENIYSGGLNVLLGRSGHSTVEINCFFTMSGLKYHNLYMCIEAQT